MKNASSPEELEWLSFHRPERAAALGLNSLASLSPDDPERARVLVQIATALSQGENLNEAERYLDQIPSGKEVGSEWHIRAGVARANIMIRRNNPSGAAAMLLDLINVASKQNLDLLAVRAMALRAKGLVLAGEGTEALRIALHVRDLTRDEASPELRFFAAEALGFVYVVLKDNERAQEPYREALQLARRLDQDVMIAGCAANLGAACSSLGLHEEGLCLLKESGEAAARADCLRLLVYALWRTAYIYIDLRDLQGVCSAVDRGLQHVERLGETQESASLLLLHAQVLLHCDERERGVCEGERVLRIVGRLKDEDIELATLATLAPCWEEDGRSAEAIEAYKRMLEIKRSQAGRFNQRSLERLAMQHEHLGPDDITSSNARRHTRSFQVQHLALRHPELSPVELIVCGGVIRGETSQEIADALVLSVHTIETHRRRIRKKLGLGRGENLYTALLMSAAA